MQIQPEYCLLWVHHWWPWPDPWWWCMTKGEWSGWVQALGSILALGAAGLAVWYQTKEVWKLNVAQEARRLEARAALVRVALQIGREVLDVQRDFQGSFNSTAMAQRYVDFKAAKAAIEAVPWGEAVNAVEVEALVRVRRPADYTQGIVQEAQGSQLADSKAQELEGYIRELERCADLMSTEAANLRSGGNGSSRLG